MKAKEVLIQYAEGKTNFQRINIRGESFQGKDLSEADFSEADIRGTNFLKVNLTSSKFIYTKAGLQKRSASALLCSCLVTLVSSSFFILVLDAFVASIKLSKPYEIIAGCICLFILFIYSQSLCICRVILYFLTLRLQHCC